MAKVDESNDFGRVTDNEARLDIEMKREDDVITSSDDDTSTPVDNGIENSENFLRKE
ncbi:hypothetical protein FG386_002994, partial [Cryptosporidium ryanae]|uniref:uncharacterized protein n=1 Tax=Cryptosporidium ryanae TaxID=515981 RepID=UPI00351A2DB6